MRRILRQTRDVAISGVFALLPVYVFLVVLSKAWKSLSLLGGGIAQMLGLKSILGVGWATAFSVLLFIAISLLAGLLVRYSFLRSASRAAERQLSKFIPDYEIYKAKAEERLQHKVKVLPYMSALIRSDEYWQPAYIVEQDPEGNCVVFLPEVPETNKGRVLLARKDQIRIVKSITATQLDASLRKTGNGLLRDCGIHIA